MKITIDKKEMTEIVKANKAKHNEQFQVAYKGWLASLEKSFKEILTKANEGEDISEMLNDLTGYRNPRPQNHASAYDKLLSMLDMAQENHIELNMESYSKFIEDDWEWKGVFNNTLRNYQ